MNLLNIKNYIKKFILFTVFIFLVCISYAEIPSVLHGIWEGKDRYVFFETVDDEDRLVIILKDYYGWYLDRVVESEEYGKEYKRDRNAATTKKSVFVALDSKPLLEDYAWELKLSYDKHDITYVPFTLINDAMYLEFWTSDENHPGFWRGNVVTDGIKVSNQVEEENFWSWYINEENQELYKIRYWKSNMEYDPSLEAVIKSQKNKDKEFAVQKHLLSAENVYTCVPGRRVIIRNLDKVPVNTLFDGKDILFNEENNIAAVNNVYLKRLVDKETFSELMEIVRFQNSRRKPDPPPLFPPANLDYHWDLIDLLEKDNVIIQKVRQRQKDFGLRGKDIGR